MKLMQKIPGSFPNPFGRASWPLALLWLAALSVLPAGAAQFQLFHAFSNLDTDGARPSYGCSFTPSGSTLYGMTTSGGTNGSGALFQINDNGTGFQIIHAFTGVSANALGNTNMNDGALPYGTPVLVGNTLYGSTGSGGSNRSGCVFAMDTDGNGFRLLRHFAVSGDTNKDGYSPQGSLTLAGSSLFGVTANGGISQEGMIFTLGTDGSGYHALYNFTNTGGDGQNPAGTLALSGATLYGMTQYGGTASGGTVFRINTDGTGYQRLHNFGIGSDGEHPLGSLIISGANLYGMTSSGGGAQGQGGGTIFKLLTNGTGYRILHNFTSPQAFSPLGALTLSGATLYGMTSGGRGTATTGPGGGTAFQIFTDGSGFQFIHNFAAPPTSTDGSYPYDTLLLSGAHLIGMTHGGGSAQNNGSIFSLLIGGSPATSGAMKVTLTPAGAVAAGAQWQVAGGAFRNSGAIASGLPAGSQTIIFKPVAGWITPASQEVVITLGATNNIAGNYVAADVTRPTLAITNVPVSGLHVSNAAFTVKGKAADKAAVTNVFFDLNGTGWNGASTGKGWTNWTADLNLPPGTNTVAAYAVDSSGNVSLTNKVKLIYVLSDTLTVNTNGRGKVSPNYNHAVLQIGASYAMKALPAAGFAFASWTDGLGSFITNRAALKFNMVSNLTLVANFRDATRPILIITSPTATLHPAGALLTVTGKARDNVAVGNILVAVNGAWTTATSTNLGSNWIAQVTLVPGTNTLTAYAVDTSGNPSLTNRVKLTYVLMDKPTVQIVGPGSVAPDYHGKSLVISNRYTMKATPAKGSVFSSWAVRGVLSTNSALTFNMSSNLTITATFTDVTRPVNVITFPLVNQKWSNAVITATGKASDNVGVSNVWCQINNGGWTLAGTTNHFARWNATNLTVVAGTNLVQAFAEDAAGNLSLTNSLKFLGFPP